MRLLVNLSRTIFFYLAEKNVPLIQRIDPHKIHPNSSHVRNYKFLVPKYIYKTIALGIFLFPQSFTATKSLL